MKTQISIILLLVVAPFTTLQSDAVSSQKDQNLIETTCRRTPNYKLCSSIIRADPGGAAADLPGLGVIVVAVVNKKSKETLVNIASLIRSAPKNLLPPLRRCKELYTTVVESDVPIVNQSIRGNPKFAETAMADAGAEVSICEEAFEGVAPSPLTKQNSFIGDVAAVARAI